jgi:prepilin peptidase CpaA
MDSVGRITEDNMMSMFILYVVLSLAVITDLRFQKIPNWLTFAAAIGGIAFNSAANGLHGFLLSIAGLVLGIAILVLFYFRGGMGGGDVKLMGAIGALLGPKGVFVAFLATALIGGMYAVMLLAFHAQLRKTLNTYWLILKTYLLTGKVFYVPPSSSEKEPRLRYGVAIALGTVLSVAMKNPIYELLHLN